MKVNYGEIISKSFGMMFKSKWLVILASFAYISGALYSNQSISWLNLNFPNNTTQQNTFESFQTTATPSPDFYNVWNTIKFESYVNFIYFSILMIIIFSGLILFNFYISSYSPAALFYGISFLDEEEDIDLTEVSLRARKKVWKLFFTNLVATIIATIVIIVLLTLSITSLFFIFSSTNTYITVAAVILAIVLSILIAIAFVIFSFPNYYLNYLVLFTDGKFFKNILDSYKYSYKYILDNFVRTIIATFFSLSFGIFSLVITLIVFFTVFIPLPFIILLNPYPDGFLYGLTPFTLLFLVIGIIFALQVIQLINSVIGIFFYTFNYLFAKNILKNE
jgi:hypothetical protein